MASDTGEYIEIDQDRLDEEWIKQPNLFFNAASELAEAKFDHSAAKANVDLVRAELGAKIRADPVRYKIGKSTVDSVNDKILTMTRYKEAIAALNEAQLKMDMLKAAVDALDHRKKALESLVYLFGQNYNAQPKIKDPETQSAMDNVVKTKLRNKNPMKKV